jgi:hypothetical protein
MDSAHGVVSATVRMSAHGWCHSVGSAHSAVRTHGWCPHCDVSVHSAHSWCPLEVLSVRLVPWMSATVLVPNVARCPWIVPTLVLTTRLVPMENSHGIGAPV